MSNQINKAAPLSDTSTTHSCETLAGLNEYQICSDLNEKISDYITGPSSIKIEHVSDYSLSPNKEWLFVVRYSDEYVTTGGAPEENALTMIDIKNSKATELFSQIYFPNYTENSWSPTSDGIVFTAAETATPDILENPDMFAVVFCTTTCKVLAKDAGPAGIEGDPAYFDGDNIRYTGMNDEEIEIQFIETSFGLPLPVVRTKTKTNYADWTLYKDKSGYSFYYPKNWYLSESGSHVQSWDPNDSNLRPGPLSGDQTKWDLYFAEESFSSFAEFLPKIDSSVEEWDSLEVSSTVTDLPIYFLFQESTQPMTVSYLVAVIRTSEDKAITLRGYFDNSQSQNGEVLKQIAESIQK